MASLAPFLPPHLVRSLAKRVPRRLPHVERSDAALLLADISGFTALTERLQKVGREGAEEIAAYINRAFRPAIRAIEMQRGSIVDFGGDALFAIFAGGGAVGRARAAAEEVRRAVAQASTRRVRLGVSQAIHFGQVIGVHLGAGDRRHYLVGGPAVRSLAREEGEADAGEIRLTAAARSRLVRERKARAVARQSSGVPALVASYLDPKLPAALRGFRGEYRRVAVLFLETRGFAASRLQRFFGNLSEVLRRYDGMLLKSDISTAGTKWLIAFGIPAAHERDPDRAARAALELRDRLPRSVVFRGGMHAGTLVNVLIGTRSRRSFDVMGDVVNTAARTMAEASWGEVLVTEDCRKLLVGVESSDRGAHRVKGKSEMLRLHLLRSAGAAVEQIRVSAPMVGRDRELERLRLALEGAGAGRGSAIGVKGEAGIGKSRLKYEVGRLARNAGFEVHEGRCVSFGSMSYGGVAAALRSILGLAERAPRQEVLDRVASEAERLGLDPVDRHHLAEVLGVRFPNSPLQHLDGNAIRLNNLISIRAFIRSRAGSKPLLVVLEDMHWADELTREAAAWMSRDEGEVPLVVLLLYRPGYEPPEGVEEIELHELDETDVEKLVEAHLGVLSGRVGRLVRDRAEGNPFYVEEFVRHLLETGLLAMGDEGYVLVRAPETEDLPVGVESLIAARLDRLTAEVKRVAQLGAVIGRSFLFSLLARLDPETSETGVGELRARELVFERSPKPLEYIFKHALTRDVAYSSILAVQRRRLHRAVGEAVEALFPAGERNPYLAMLGYHWERAGQIARARRCYLPAAREATARYAHEEAERLYRAYLSLIARPSLESITARSELANQVLRPRGRVEEAERELRQALTEATRARDRTAEALVLRELSNVLIETGRGDEARACQEKSLALAEQLGDRRGAAICRGLLGRGQAERGRWVEALELLEGSLATARELGDGRREAHTLSMVAVCQQNLRRSKEARATYGRALRLARKLGDRAREGIVLGNLATLDHEEGRFQQAREIHEQALQIAREVGDRRSEGMKLNHLAVLNQNLGRLDEAGELYRDAIAIHQALVEKRLESEVWGNLATLHTDRNELGEAGDCLQRSLRLARETYDRESEGRACGNLSVVMTRLGRLQEALELSETAASIARETFDPRAEAVWMSRMSRQIALVTGDWKRAERIARKAERQIRATTGDSLPTCEIVCELGHNLLQGKRSARRLLARAEAIARELGVSDDSGTGLFVAGLRGAQSLLEAGGPLICGFAPEDVPPGVYRWLREHRPEAIPPEVLARLKGDGTLRIRTGS